MRYPMAQPVLAHIAIVINKYGPAGQVGEHGAGVTRRHMQVKDSSVVDVLPVLFRCR